MSPGELWIKIHLATDALKAAGLKDAPYSIQSDWLEENGNLEMATYLREMDLVKESRKNSAWKNIQRQ